MTARFAARALLLPAVLAPVLAGCGGWQSMLEPGNPAGARIENLWWFAFWTTGALSTLVIAGLLYAVHRARRAAGADSAAGPGGSAAVPGGREERFILLAGAGLPALFLVTFLVAAVRTGTSVSAPPDEPELVVEVTGHQFWWEIHYPEHDLVTANEIHIPVGEPVRVRLRSADVIHSFWVPRLSPGKTDMTPGRTTSTWLLAEEPGRYRGQCAEFCGTQHALMSLLVVATPRDEFDGWIEERSTPPPAPSGSTELLGRTLFFTKGCAACHTIMGTSPTRGTRAPGPDLSDLASRETLAALTLENTRANLGGWILDPHRFKPGVRMPATRMTGGEHRALLAYLETLR